MKTTHLIFARIVPAVVASLATLAAGADTPIDERASMDPQGRVSVSNIAGEVKIRGWDRSEVKLTGRLSENVERLDFDASGGNVSIEVIYKKKHKANHGWDWGRNDSDTYLDLQMPKDAELDASTVSANIDVDDHLGPQDIQSVSGEITLTLSRRETDVQSVSGNIDARGHDVEIEAQLGTVSGDIEVRRFRGDLEAESVSGDIDIRDARVRDGEFESVSGDVDIVLSLASNGNLEMETVSGDIGVGFVGTVDARMRIDTHSGDIDSFFGHSAERIRRHGPGKRLHADVGAGSADVSISTLSGDVRNRTRD